MDHRTERITEAIREELSEMIGYEMDDPRVGSAIVTEVQISPDKRHAMVRVRVGENSDPTATMEALEHARNFLRRQLASRLTATWLSAADGHIPSSPADSMSTAPLMRSTGMLT